MAAFFCRAFARAKRWSCATLGLKTWLSGNLVCGATLAGFARRGRRLVITDNINPGGARTKRYSVVTSVELAFDLRAVTVLLLVLKLLL